MQSNLRIGLIGLGKMGTPIARHLKSAAQAMYVYDLDPQAMSPLVAEGCIGLDQAGKFREHCDCVFLLVSFDQQVLDVCLGADGLFNTDRALTVVVCSTIEPSTMELLNQKAPANIVLMDAPLCRGEQAAEDGTLLALVGGEVEAVRQISPYLKTFCSDVEHLGSLGKGQVAKALNNFMLWSCIAVNTEALKLGRQYGLDQEKLRQALLKSSGDNWALRTWNRPRTMPWAEKDMMIILNMADENRLPMPMAGFIKEYIKVVKEERGLTQSLDAKPQA